MRLWARKPDAANAWVASAERLPRAAVEDERPLTVERARLGGQAVELDVHVVGDPAGLVLIRLAHVHQLHVALPDQRGDLPRGELLGELSHGRRE